VKLFLQAALNDIIADLDLQKKLLHNLLICFENQEFTGMRSWKSHVMQIR